MKYWKCRESKIIHHCFKFRIFLCSLFHYKIYHILFLSNTIFVTVICLIIFFNIALSLHVPEHIDLIPSPPSPLMQLLSWWTNYCSNFLSHYEDVEPLRILCSTKAFLVVQPKILRYVHSTTIYLLSLSNSSYPKYTRVISLKTISGEGHLSNTHAVYVPL